MTTAPSTQPSSITPAATAPPPKKGLPLLLKIVLGVAFLLGVLAIIVALQPSEFHIARTMKMFGPADKVFAQVNNFHKWDDWSPWVKIDPNAKNSFEGPESGEGAIFRWAGNAEVGEGSMTILESKPNESVKIKLQFLKPFEGDALTQFTIKPEGDQTAVTWSMDGKNNFVGKLLCLLIMDMEKMIGGRYDEGLAKMKSIVEAPADVKPARDEQKPNEAPAEKADEPGKSNREDSAMTENKRTIETYMEGFRKSDHALILSCLTEDVEWEIPGATRLSGKVAFDKEIENEAFVGSPAITVTRLTEENDVVVAEGSVRSEKKAGGFLKLVFCDVFEMKSGKIKRLISYLVPVA